jgi:anaerobic selenocysteine-containing dehydrogenase
MAVPELRAERVACRCCPAACGMIATIQGSQILKLEGDPQHPVSQGYSCAKGRAVPAKHHDGSRLDRPRPAGAETTWTSCLQDLGGRLRQLRAEYGAGAVGVFAGTGGA